ncbi:acetyl-CoA carboxylase, biotin carboxyl carrier protein [Helicobacter monodelphidis]|uniref:acetyl-CoA carboxylase biotin carboxyl carrier protein n=1 Tax=Helicobacter sp. 15-1451 TaxID=2004995 RepID=UPI000DCBD1A5|nr:acetyl-CoA carboxylase biotin carboxyl carrier protein [Helicobacter sp. 15-1451]RAX58153.1 acetyl-CoA carboxylase, biotin carboxyl carrier protein [Helicobacter sp. 15-1451]
MKLQEIQELMESFDSTQACKMHLQIGDFCLKLEKPNSNRVESIIASEPTYSIPTAQVAGVPQVPQIAAKAENPTEVQGEKITSPMVGTFYRSPSPGASAYVNIGDKVKRGDTLAIVEAMKIMNEIEAEFDCKILDIVPSDAQPIEYGTVLFVVEKL